MRMALRQYLDRQAFFPDVIGIFINPFYFARKGLAFHIKAMSAEIGGVVLDVGCGTKPYAHMFSSTRYVGLEIDTPENRKGKKADYFYDGEHFPFENGFFDSVVANQVFEHVFNPDEFLNEIHRVLKQDGKFLISVPFLWDEHEQPHDFARYSSFGLRHLLEKHGFKVIRSEKSMNDIRVIFQSINMYLFKKLAVRNKFLFAFSILFLMAPFNVLGEVLSWILPKNDDLYLDNIILAQKIKKGS